MEFIKRAELKTANEHLSISKTPKLIAGCGATTFNLTFQDSKTAK